MRDEQPGEPEPVHVHDRRVQAGDTPGKIPIRWFEVVRHAVALDHSRRSCVARQQPTGSIAPVACRASSAFVNVGHSSSAAAGSRSVAGGITTTTRSDVTGAPGLN